ncbi:unnamed protein product [Amaranthus hypochondriacus]
MTLRKTLVANHIFSENARQIGHPLYKTRNRYGSQRRRMEVVGYDGIGAKEVEDIWRLTQQLGALSNDDNGMLVELQRSKRIQLLMGLEP